MFIVQYRIKFWIICCSSYDSFAENENLQLPITEYSILFLKKKTTANQS